MTRRRTGGGCSLRRPDDKDRPASETPLEEARRLLAAQESEYQAQRTVAAWLNAHKILYCHVPNGRDAGSSGGIWRAQGVKAGVPDLLIFDLPTVCAQPHHRDAAIMPQSMACEGCALAEDAKGVALELKSGKGGRVSEQRVCAGSREAIDWLESLGFGKATR